MELKYFTLPTAQGALPRLVELAKQERVVLTKNGTTPVAVLLSIDEFRSMQAMLVLSGDLDHLAKLYRTHRQVLSEGPKDFQASITESATMGYPA